MDEPVHEIEYKDHLIRIFSDDDASNPRKEFDNMGRMICFHRRYDLGDKKKQYWENNPQEFRERIERNAARGAIVALPLYLYDHSGITMRTTPFSCPWDSGQVGWIYITKDDIRKEYSVKRVTKKTVEKVLNVLRGEVETYDHFISGRVYGYEVVKKGAEEDEMYNRDVLDSCWGFYGDYDDEYMIGEAKSFIDREVEANG